MSFEAFAQSSIVANIGWSLLHSIWQIGVVAVTLCTALRILRGRTPNLRYLVSVAALLIAVALPFVTFINISRQAALQASPGEPSESPVSRVPFEPANIIAVRSTDAGDPIALGYATSARDLISNSVSWLNRNVPSLLPLVVFAWLLGVGFFSLRLSGGFWHLRRNIYRGSSTVDDGWLNGFTRLCEITGVSRAVVLVKSEIVSTPIAIGILKPAIVIPASLFLQISPRELETIIAHELIHIRRYDPVVNIFQCLIESLFFYHPGVWWISRQIRREREFAADSAVLEVFQDSHVTYASALANLEAIRLQADQQSPPRFATAANGGNFMQRIQRILKIKTEVSKANSAWSAGLALSLTSVFLLTLFWFSSSDVVNAQKRSGERKLAIGFVSIPPLDRTANPPKDADATARILIQELKEHKVPATGFLQGGMISDGEKMFPVRANIARLWIDAGFEVGLGGFKHIWLSKTPADEYISNIEKNERIAKQLIGEKGLPARYFSYPFLNTGKDVEDKAKVEAWLASRGYKSVKYTFDNSEWMYSFAYDVARNDNDLSTMKEVREAYLAYMARMFDHYEAYSAELFGRDIPQTMVLTPSRLITDTADDFFAMASKRGYTFITLDEAQNDPAYKTKEEFMGDAGISWFERWTLAKGGPLRKEPEVDDDVQKVWKEREAATTKK